MDLGLRGLRVLVTAGGSGIGRAIAENFANEGAKVHICDISEQAMADVTQRDARISASSCDVSDRASVASLFEQAYSSLGGLDVLVNNAGIAGPTGRVDEIAPEDFDRTLAINITGQFNCARLAVPLLMQSTNASILNVSSVAGKFGFRYRSAYAASKWAVIGFTKSLSIELGELGIRVNALLPGLVEGPRQEAVLAAKAKARGIGMNEMKSAALGMASIKEMITPQQLADTVLFLASDRARTTSGQAISICGDLQALS